MSDKVGGKARALVPNSAQALDPPKTPAAKTRDAVADIAGVSHDTLAKYEYVKEKAEAGNEVAIKMMAALKRNSKTTHGANKKVKEDVAKNERDESRDAAVKAAPPVPMSERIIVGDFRAHADRVTAGPPGPPADISPPARQLFQKIEWFAQQFPFWKQLARLLAGRTVHVQHCTHRMACRLPRSRKVGQPGNTLRAGGRGNASAGNRTHGNQRYNELCYRYRCYRSPKTMVRCRLARSREVHPPAYWPASMIGLYHVQDSEDAA